MVQVIDIITLVEGKEMVKPGGVLVYFLVLTRVGKVCQRATQLFNL